MASIDLSSYPGIAQLAEQEAVPEWAEDSIAREFAERHKDNLRYVHEWGRWLRYDGNRWSHDRTLYAYGLVRDLCAEIASRQEDRRVAGIASAKSVSAVTQLARADRRIAATADQWDTDHWLLNADTHTIDLRTSTVREPRATDYITKKTACDCAPLGTTCPLWLAFLQRVTSCDAELQKFLQRYIGYCLTGLTKEHAFVFAHGTGGNGKGTFLNTLVGILGDYATVADTSTFVASRGERHPTDVAHLVGARLVVAQETQEGRRWNESRIKEMTGGDRMTARFMRQDYFDFEPTHKLFITGNHKPSLASVDPAIKRRLLLVPFLVQISDAERDPDLRDKLRPEWPAILRWAVNGAQDWQRIGLQPPSVVQNATADYFAAEDTLALWAEDCLVLGDKSTLTSARELYASWRQWCEDHGHRPGSQKEFSSKLQDKGFEYKRTKQVRGFYAKLAKK